MKTMTLSKNLRRAVGPLLAGAALAAALNLRAATTVSGIIADEAWTVQNSPYVVSGDLLVVDLAIGAGVEVQFASNVVCEVAGLLQAEGTAEQPVLFTSADPAAGWRGIFFNNCVSDSFLTHCRIEGATLGAIRLTNCTPGFTNCVLANNSSVGSGGALAARISEGTLVLTGCVLTNNSTAGTGGAVAITIQNAKMVLTNCVFSANSSTNRGGGIYADAQKASLILVDCTLDANSSGDLGGGLSAYCEDAYLSLYRTVLYANRSLRDRSGYGGGMYVYMNSSSHVVMDQCIVAENLATAFGGGIYAEAYPSGFLILRNCSVTNNSTVVSGGGVDARRCETLVERCVIGGNAVGPCYYPQGGGLNLQGGGITLKNSSVVGNVCSGWSAPFGAAIYACSGLTMMNCIIATNAGSGNYGEHAAIYPAGDSKKEIVNCTIIGNTGPAVSSFYNTGINLTNCILFFNNSGDSQLEGSSPITLAYCDIEGGPTTNGNKKINPILNPATLELNSYSPCIDAGDPAPVFNDACFPPSRGTVRNDMGAFGGPGACCWSGPCESVEIRAQPAPVTSCLNRPATFAVLVTGNEPLTYQWRFHGTNAADAPVDILNATNANYTISAVQASDAGYYSVVVANLFGTATSAPALLTVTPVCVGVDLYAGLTLSGGVPGQSYQVQCLAQLGPTNAWLPLTNITMAGPEMFWLDPNPANRPTKFYRVVPQ
jgi:predicted outer membrane repeat protein